MIDQFVRPGVQVSMESSSLQSKVLGDLNKAVMRTSLVDGAPSYSIVNIRVFRIIITARLFPRVRSRVPGSNFESINSLYLTFSITLSSYSTSRDNTDIQNLNNPKSGQWSYKSVRSESR